MYNQGVNFHHENLVNIHVFQLKKVKTQFNKSRKSVLNWKGYKNTFTPRTVE